MKQYTSEQQTAKLIELGFGKPKSVSQLTMDEDMQIVPHFAYSIGDLIDVLPIRVNGWEFDISHDFHFERWVCHFDPTKHYGAATNLIDALYILVVKLKEEGVI